jgi:hypothetical protein
MATPAIVATMDGQENIYWFDVQYSPLSPNRLAHEQLNHSFATSDITRSSSLSNMWEQVDLTPAEEDVVRSLQLINPDVRGLSFLRGEPANGKRVAYVKLAGSEMRVPLGSLGEGVSRVLGLTLALVNAKDGILLVDEIENGVHYSIQEKLWGFFLKLAARLNVQVFATTHSWDCLRSFQNAGTRNECVVIRLQDRRGEIKASLFDAERLAIATREAVEIR